MKTKTLDKQLATYSTAAGAVLLGAAASEGAWNVNTALNETVGIGLSYDLNLDGLGGGRMIR